MNWDDVRVFLAVARAGQFVAAARGLKVDHATAARRVTALERALNVRLLDRRTTGVLLTESGERFLSAAERMETAFLQAQAELGDRDVELSGTVRIGAPDGLSTYYLAARFAALAERYPAIAIQLVPTPQAGMVGRREVDIAVVLEKPEAAASSRASSPTIRSGSSLRPLMWRATRRRRPLRVWRIIDSWATSRS